MKVLVHVYISNSPRAAGIQQSIRVCYYLAKIRDTQVHLQICTWAFKNKQELLNFFGFEDLENLKITFFFHPFAKSNNKVLLRIWGLVFHLWQFFKLLLTSEKNHYDVFFARGRYPIWHIICKSMLKYKIVLELHEIFFLNNVSKDKIYDTTKKIDYEKFSYHHADGVIVISDTLRRLAETKWGTPPAPVTVIPSGTVLFESEPLLTEKSLRRVYFVGNYYPFSGLDFVVQALVKVPDVTLTIVGGGGNSDPDYLRINALLDQLDLQNRVTFRGFIQPKLLPEIYREADILVLPLTKHIRAKFFVSPLKLFDYMSARRPIIASNLATIREILTDGENALLVEPEDPESIANAIIQLKNSPSLASRLGEKAYHDVQKYSMDRKCEAIQAFLVDIIDLKISADQANIT